jgi:excisionase family DNA binding protein
MSNLASDLISGAQGAASFIGITPRAIYHMVEAGQLPVIKKGRRLYFRKSELEAAFSSDPIAA